jgi:endonuclease YncB( thermonuclease family)
VRRPRHRSRRRNRRDRFTFWLTAVVCGGFAGTLAALQAGSIPRAGAEMPFLAAAAPAPDGLSARFGFCHTGGGRNCVVDGDTFWFEGEKYRIADIDTPETHPPRCAEEAALGRAATERLQRWLNEGAFSLENVDRDADRYGRKLRIVTRGGASVGDALVGEGLARRWEGRRRPWC